MDGGCEDQGETPKSVRRRVCWSPPNFGSLGAGLRCAARVRFVAPGLGGGGRLRHRRNVNRGLQLVRTDRNGQPAGDDRSGQHPAFTGRPEPLQRHRPAHRPTAAGPGQHVVLSGVFPRVGSREGASRLCWAFLPTPRARSGGDSGLAREQQRPCRAAVRGSDVEADQKSILARSPNTSAVSMSRTLGGSVWPRAGPSTCRSGVRRNQGVTATL